MGSFGLANKVTFYVSYPLYGYATGSGHHSAAVATGDIDDETANSIITLNPSKQHLFDVTTGDMFYFTNKMNRKSDFFMVLGHDFEKTSQSLTLENTDGDLSATTVINNCVGETPAYNGWSLVTMDNQDTGSEVFKIIFSNEAQCSIGSILWGSSWTTPINCNVGQSYSLGYGYKQKKTVSGKTLSTLNYHKLGNWGKLPAWELMTTDENEYDYLDWIPNRNERTGIRKWDVSFSYLQDSQVLGQNNMITSNAWTQDSASDYSTGADGNTSLYNTHNSQDFYSSVYKLTLGGHLPIVVNISDSKNPDQWAIVRITKFTMKENNPKFIDCSMTLEEQV